MGSLEDWIKVAAALPNINWNDSVESKALKFNRTEMIEQSELVHIITKTITIMKATRLTTSQKKIKFQNDILARKWCN